MKTNTANQLPAIRGAYNRILIRLDREARADRCQGDICCGWDWPTLAAVRPIEYAELCGLRHQYRAESRALMSAGLHPSQTR